VTTYDWTNRPALGQAGGQEIFLGGFSGLFYQGLANNSGNLRFVTLTDRGPNGNDRDGKRPFVLPDFQPEIVSFELNQSIGSLNITERVKLTDSRGKAITGLPNLQAAATGLAYTDEVPIDLAGKTLNNDALGADVEGIVVAPNGDYWLVDEYRPAIYQFNKQGQLINRFIPAGTAAAVGQPAGTFGTEALPAVYAQRRANRGFEAIALEGAKLYAFIQSAIDNPDSTGDTTSRNSRNLRVLEFDVTTSKVIGEYLYLLDSISGSGNARTDKIGDAVSLGNGRFAVVERDDRAGVDSNKLIYQIDLKGATNINNTAALKLPTGKTIEQLSPAELTAAGITPVSKRIITNAAQAGYTGVEKIEGLALIDANTLAVINDNDFGITETTYNPDGSVRVTVRDVPVKLGLLELATPLNVDISALANRGENTLYISALTNQITAMFGDNTVYAGEGAKSVQTGGGNDRIYAGSGNDFIQAGAGRNLIYAGEGTNQIFSEIGDDTIYAGSGDDTIAAGLGNNLIYAGEGNNTITSTGIDTIYTGSGRDRFVLDRGPGEATIIGFGTNDRISLGGTLRFADLTLRQSGFDTVLAVGTDTLATLRWTNVNSLTSSQFAV
jgi:3-phytase